MQAQTDLLAAVIVSCLLLGCGAPGAPGGSLAAPEQADRSDAGAKTAMIADAGTPEVPADLPAEGAVATAPDAVPEQPPVQPETVQLEALPLDGPHKSLQQFCTRLRKDGRGRCARGKNGWAPNKIGPRGRIRAAETFRVRRGKGEEAYEICPFAIRAPDGWYVALDDVPCQSGDKKDPERVTSLMQLRWADELAFGVLLVERYGEGWFEGSDGDDNKAPVPSVSGSSEERRYCGIDRDDKPRCTHWFTLPSGSYALTDAFGERAALESTDPGDQIADEEGPLVARPLFGPFLSIGDYCKALPTPWDMEIPPDGDDYGYGDADAPDRCAAGKGGWNRRPPLGGLGPFLGAKLIRIKGEMAGAKVEYCRLAIRTDEGWYVSHETEQCAGVLGPSSTARVKTTDLAWHGPDSAPVLGVEFQVITGTRYRAKDDLEKYDLSRSNWIRLCGVGASGRPSCTRDVAAGCEDPISGKSLPVRWTIHEGKLIMNAPTRTKPGKKKQQTLDEDDEQSADNGCWAPDSFPIELALEFP